MIYVFFCFKKDDYFFNVVYNYIDFFYLVEDMVKDFVFVLGEYVFFVVYM